MAFDGITVAALKNELSDILIGGRIAKITQPESDEIILAFKIAGSQYRLLLSADASLPLLYFTSTNKPAPMTAPGFCMLLRKHLQSGRITAIRQPGLERILMFDIEHLNELGDLCEKTLVIELMGKHSNIIFCEKRDDKMIIIDAIKHVSAMVSSVREVLPGREYFIPNTLGKKDPLSDISYEEFSSSLGEKSVPVAKAIYSVFTGLSPVAANELCYKSGIDSDIPTSELDDIRWQSLYNNFCYLIRDIKNSTYSPEIVFEKPGVPREFSSYHLSMYEDLSSSKYDSISSLLESYYAQKNLVVRIRQRSGDLRKIIQNAIERNAKKLDIQLKQLKDTEKKDRYKIYGELINAYGYNLESGCKSFEAENYYTGEMVTIPLDPMFTPQENSKRYFDKYQKLKRTEDACTKLIEETQSELSHLQSVLTSLDIALKEEDLVEIRMELEECGVIKKHSYAKGGSGKKGSKALKVTSKPFHYISSDGLDIYVGKNNIQNDELTFKFANGGDWWFHSKKVPGSHVILKANGNDIPDRAFEEAARLAAYYSAGREQDKVEIDYLLRKNVKKPGGAKPGFVVYYTNYSMAIDSDISALTLVD